MDIHWVVFVCLISWLAGYFLAGASFKIGFIGLVLPLVAVFLSLLRVVKVLGAGQWIPALKVAAQVVVSYGDIIWYALSFFSIGRAVMVREKEAISHAGWFRSPESLNIASASIFNAGLFFYFSIGKIKHWQEMELFFKQSGYPVFLAHFTTAFECLLSVVLLIKVTPEIKIWTAWLLVAEMLAAIFTHFRNDDPFSDSRDALCQLLVLLVLLFWLYRVTRRRPGGLVHVREIQ